MIQAEQIQTNSDHSSFSSWDGPCIVESEIDWFIMVWFVISELEIVEFSMVEFTIFELFSILDLTVIFDLVTVESLTEESSIVEFSIVEPDDSEFSKTVSIVFDLEIFE